MEALTKEEIERIRKVNEMKRIANKSDDFKLSYFPGANLMLLKRKGKKWLVESQTGKWFDDMFDEGWIQ